ncbi:ABC transporter substrate-binding protein [Leptolyngbya sp. 'hensonii']|uniref:substrate-binding domain-containing protein n=1 Tax=Leptolyngbya sp. 'hensonii' TaxID=1922337 RepID=UPI0009502DC9|nr:substrate-binding domain-containing protein [Leptolyngbya sp. 'hensonii']OLP18871.1 ABC transporter substrate-binding protein [Leptolyngbya sp. 'hensonii']
MKTKPIVSLGIIAVALGLAYAPLPGLSRTITVVAGTELQEPLTALREKFQQKNPDIMLELKFQGSQDVVNRYLDDKNDFKPTVLIPANGELLVEMNARWKAQNNADAFYDSPRPVAKTLLVAIAWNDRGKVLFPDNTFRWERLEQAMQTGNWSAIGGQPDWGNFDFLMTDPERSNSGQITMTLWSQNKLGNSPITPANLGQPTVQSLFSLVHKSVYQPPRSTDVLLQEFISRGPNDADVATVYESIALYRWQQSGANQGKPYQIYYLNPTIETVSTAVIARRQVDRSTADAARKFLDFLTQPEQQAVFVQYGFRPVVGNIDLKSVPNSPWNQNVPGAQMAPPGQVAQTPNTQTLEEIKRLWSRSQ